jgi:L-threonylcarbamoyladenylate synthase
MQRFWTSVLIIPDGRSRESTAGFSTLITARAQMAKTVSIEVNAEDPEAEAMDRAAAVIRGGGLVAFPTETVYGLGADAMNRSAVMRIFQAKGRPSDNPLIVHLSGLEMLGVVAQDIPGEAYALIDRFWPGPLTLVLSRKPGIADWVSAGLSTIAVRMPRGRIALELIRRSRTLIAAPSANISGRPSPTRARDVWMDLNGKIDLVLDAGSTVVGIESTVLDLTARPPIILRPGWISRSELEAAIGPVRRPASEEELKRSPGTRHRHYSPRARVVLVQGSTPEALRQICLGLRDHGKVAFIGHSKLDLASESIEQILLDNNAKAYASSIYSSFRDLDAAGVSVIVVQGTEGDDASDAIMDRLGRAASETITGG